MRWAGLSRRVKGNCLLVGLGPTRKVTSVEDFLIYPSAYLHEFRRKTQKTLNLYIDKRDRGLNPAPPVYQI